MHDLLTATIVRSEPREGSGKGILGTMPSSSNKETRQQATPNSASKVITDTTLRPPKLTFPKFDGDEPKAWFRKCECFFLIHPVAQEQNVIIASIHFEKRAKTWFQSYYSLKENLV